jgi:glycerol-3-phosphate acyltransferase PlsY
MIGPISLSNLSILLGYFLGAIPFGLIIGRMSGVDVRKSGSGNIGATNINRVLGLQYGITVLGLDVLKGMVAVVIAQIVSPGLSPWYPLSAGLAAILGHSFSVFMRFRGGRSVAVSLGVFLLLNGTAIGIAVLTFILVTAISRYVSLGSVMAAVIFVVATVVRLFIFHQGGFELLIASTLAAILILVRHRANIVRLLRGEEHRLTFHRKG